MMIIVTATTTITATTPPTMAAVLSDGAATVVVLSEVVMDVVKEGLALAHCGSPNELMATEQLLSTSRCKRCTAMVESLRETKVSKYVINCELVTWAVP